MESGEGCNNDSSQPPSENLRYAFSENEEIPILNSLNDLSVNTASYPSTPLLQRYEPIIRVKPDKNFDGSSPNESSTDRQTPKLSHNSSSTGSDLNQRLRLTSNRFSRHESNVSKAPALQESSSKLILYENSEPKAGKIPTPESHLLPKYELNASHQSAFKPYRSYPTITDNSNPVTGQIQASESRLFSRYQSNVLRPLVFQPYRNYAIVTNYSNQVTGQMPFSESHLFPRYESNASHRTALQASRRPHIVKEYSNPVIVQMPTSESHLFPKYESNASHRTALQASRRPPIVNEYSNALMGNLSGTELSLIPDSYSPWMNKKYYSASQYRHLVTRHLTENARRDFHGQNLNTHEPFQQSSSYSPSDNVCDKSLFQKRVNQRNKNTKENFNTSSPKQFVNVIVVGADAATSIGLIRTFAKNSCIIPHKSLSMVFQEYFFKQGELWSISVWCIRSFYYNTQVLKGLCESSNAAIVLAYEVTDRNSLSVVRTWIKKLKRNVPANVPIILVGNNRDCEILASKIHSNNVDITNRLSYIEGLKLLVEFQLSEFFECSVESVEQVVAIFAKAIDFASVKFI